MRHVICKYVTSHMKESLHIWISPDMQMRENVKHLHCTLERANVSKSCHA